MNVQPYKTRTNPAVIGAPVDDDKAHPWRALRPFETRIEWQERMSHTCWRCDYFDEDNEALDAHEAEH